MNRGNSYSSIVISGLFLFIFLYLTAAYRYPGGWPGNPSGAGFSWLHNYWCNLLNETALNGKPNTGRLPAMGGMLVLGITMLIFWMQLGAVIRSTHPNTAKAMLLSGAVSSVTMLYLPFGFHDGIVNGSSAAGLIAVTLLMHFLYTMRYRGLFIWGLLNVLLVGLNNYLYYTEDGTGHLPWVQKISFLSFLLWMAVISRSVRNPSHAEPQQYVPSSS